MQETGNNIETNDKVLSIRLSLNGLYFSASHTNLTGQVLGESIGIDHEKVRGVLEENGLSSGDFGTVRITLDTETVVLAPTEAFDLHLREPYLKINGHELGDDQCALSSEPCREVIAIMGWNRAVIETLTEIYGTRLTFSSPIMENIARGVADSVEIAIHGSLIYLTLHSSKLEFAECLPINSIADTIYYIETLKKEFGLDKRTIYIYGDDAKATVKQLKRYYKRVILGDNN